MSHTVPEPIDHAEALRDALTDHAVTHPAAAAVTLLCGMPGRLHATEQMQPYLRTRGDQPATVDWHKLGLDLMTGDIKLDWGGHVLTRPELQLLRIAAALGGGPPVRLGEAVAALDGELLDAAVLAVAHAGGRWDR